MAWSCQSWPRTRADKCRGKCGQFTENPVSTFAVAPHILPLASDMIPLMLSDWGQSSLSERGMAGSQSSTWGDGGVGSSHLPCPGT